MATKFSDALAWVTVTTLMGSVAAILLAGQLIKAFKPAITQQAALAQAQVAAGA